MLSFANHGNRSVNLLPLLAALAAGVVATGCLEASSSSKAKDGGVEASHKDVGGSTPEPDAKSRSDAKATVDAARDSKSPVADTSVPVDSGVVIPTCTNPTANQVACTTCVEQSCVSTVSTALTACAAFYSCFQKCDCSDTACVDTCLSKAPASCTTALGAVAACEKSSCASACEAPATDAGHAKDASADACKDGGACKAPPGDGGSAAWIPNCASPSASQSSTYTACSTCDQAHCESDVASALTSCTAYYACYKACACSDLICLAGCSADSTAACAVAGATLSGCQTLNCALECSGL
jgi:hypothetical protein